MRAQLVRYSKSGQHGEGLESCDLKPRSRLRPSSCMNFPVSFWSDILRCQVSWRSPWRTLSRRWEAEWPRLLKCSPKRKWHCCLVIPSRSHSFPGGLVVRIRRFHRRGPGSIPGQGMVILFPKRLVTSQRALEEGLCQHLILYNHSNVC